jgi:dihydroorotate dehydrogenase
VGVWVKGNHGAQLGEESVQTRLGFLGFKGECSELKREAVSVLYEAAANPRDHAPIVGIGGLGSRIGGA